MPPTPLPDEHHIVRHVNVKGLIATEDGIIQGMFPQSLRLRPEKNEEYLSTSWLEYFSGAIIAQLTGVLEILLKKRSISRKSALVCWNVGKFKNICAQKKMKVRILHEPTKNDPAYTKVRRYQSDDEELLLELAAEAAIHPIAVIDPQSKLVATK